MLPVDHWTVILNNQIICWPLCVCVWIHCTSLFRQWVGVHGRGTWSLPGGDGKMERSEFGTQIPGLVWLTPTQIHRCLCVKCSRDIFLNIKSVNESHCRSVLYNGLKRRGIWSQATAFLSTTSPAGPGTFPHSARPTNSQVRKPKKRWIYNCSAQLSQFNTFNHIGIKPLHRYARWVTI